MLKHISQAVLFFLLLSLLVFPQQKISTQLQGALISPFEARKGVGGTVTLNYHINEKFDIYGYSGLLYWNDNNLRYNGRGNYFESVSDEKDHYLVPVLLGARYNGKNETSWFPFVETEAGLSFLSYEKGTIYEIINPETGDVERLQLRNINEKEEVFISVGVGAGLHHQINDWFGMELGMNVNSNFNEDNPFFKGSLTYIAIYWGFHFSLI